MRSIAREDLIERAEPFQPILEDADEQQAFLKALAARGIHTVETFLIDLHHKARQREQTE